MVQQRLAKSYKREMMLQVLFYSLAFMGTYVLFAIGNLMLLLKKQPPLVFFFFIQVLFPLGGIFNILIFTRPSTRVEKTRSPHLSWLRAFWIVFKNGGDPTPATVNRPTTGSQIDKDAGGDSKSYFNDKSLKFGVADDLTPLQNDVKSIAPSDALKEYSNIYDDISQDAPRISSYSSSYAPSDPSTMRTLDKDYYGNIINSCSYTGERFNVSSDDNVGDSYGDISDYAPISQVHRDSSQESTQIPPDGSDNQPKLHTHESKNSITNA